MRKNGIQCATNADTFIKDFDTDDNLKQVLEEKLNPDTDITYKHWKRVNEGEKYRWKEIEENCAKEEFIDCVMKEVSAFRAHVSRGQNQYREMKRLRENLPEGEVVLWMDFAENYCCSSVEEVQSAFWNVEMISLHTMVTYLPPNCEKTKQCFVAVLSCLEHNAASVYCILQKNIPFLKKEVPNLKCIHYLTDSPTSQYRNKTIFQILCNHLEQFGVSARWNYLESGHGKGPCDGFGASVKRAADMSVKQGKSTIQGAKDFLVWADKANVASKVKYIAYNENDALRAQETITSKTKPVAVSGTLKLHTVVPINQTTIATRETSCSCD